MIPNRCDPQAPRPEEVLRDRLLLYVRTLRLPPREGLDLALKAMDALYASGLKETSFAEAQSLEKAMEALRALCSDRGLLPDANVLPTPVPPYNRGSMPPARISMTRGGFSLRGLIGRLRRSGEGRTR